MTESISPAIAFQNLAQELLESQGFDTQKIEQYAEDDGFDFLATRDGESWAVEVKYYRTQRAQAALLNAAASRLVARGIKAQAGKGMLIVSCSLPLALRQRFEERYRLSLFDRSDLLGWAADAPQLFEQIEALLEIESPTTYEEQVRPRSQGIGGRPLPQNGPPEDRSGSQLCQQLQTIKRGRKTWGAYETLCIQILRYLFPNDLQGWHKQKRTDDGLNRFDYICRMRPTTDFWRFLIEHLDSRYVLFEFKNYTGPIKQGQILTTEKYLLDRGLRRVAIVVTRSGAHKSAVAMAQGAMREHGKLMIVVNDGQVCRMLHMKERGEDPTDLLFDLTDEFLLALPR
jgi:hypothetical protein